jgi:hypothetical protein
VALTAEGERQLLGDQENRMQAQVQVAKGVTAAAAGNDVTAMAFYAEALGIDGTLESAKERLDNFGVTVSATSIRERANAEIQLREKWNKIFQDLYTYVMANTILSIEADFSNIKETSIGSNTISLQISPGLRFIPNRTTVLVWQTILKKAEEASRQSRNYEGTARSRNVEVIIRLYNEYGDCIAEKTVGIGSFTYAWDYYVRDSRREFGVGSSRYPVRNGVPSYKKIHDDTPLLPIQFSGVPLNDVTDTLTVKVEEIFIYSLGNGRLLNRAKINVPIVKPDDWLKNTNNGQN